MSMNRIGESCWYLPEVWGMNPERQEWCAGKLRAWSTNHVETEHGPGHYPAAVIEDAETLRCLTVPVNNVSFASVPPQQT